jgi:tRNA dimethylallyltransferase
MAEPLRAMRPLIVVAGPTGSGKSELALTIAERFQGEILNCDSVQVYRYFDIGTAKTPVEERRGVPHHLIDALNPDETFTAGEFSRVGRRLLEEISSRGHLPVVAGGTGFYVRALIDGLAPGPERDDALRLRLADRERRRPQSLHRILTRFDVRTAARIHANDVAKVMRALEICLKERRPAADVFDAGRDSLEGFRALKVGLFPEREALYSRLEARLDQMFAVGLMDEVSAILSKGFPESSKPFESIGYKQALQATKGEISPRDALFYARRDTRRYAKRQMTWFRREPGLQILRGFGDDREIQREATDLVAAFLADSGC